MIHERIDWGLAVLATYASGGGRVSDNLPPWYQTETGPADAMVSALQMLANRWESKRE